MTSLRVTEDLGDDSAPAARQPPPDVPALVSAMALEVGFDSSSDDDVASDGTVGPGSGAAAGRSSDEIAGPSSDVAGGPGTGDSAHDPARGSPRVLEPRRDRFEVCAPAAPNPGKESPRGDTAGLARRAADVVATAERLRKEGPASVGPEGTAAVVAFLATAAWRAAEPGPGEARKRTAGERRSVAKYRGLCDRVTQGQGLALFDALHSAVGAGMSLPPQGHDRVFSELSEINDGSGEGGAATRRRGGARLPTAPTAGESAGAGGGGATVAGPAPASGAGAAGEPGGPAPPSPGAATPGAAAGEAELLAALRDATVVVDAGALMGHLDVLQALVCMSLPPWRRGGAGGPAAAAPLGALTVHVPATVIPELEAVAGAGGDPGDAPARAAAAAAAAAVGWVRAIRASRAAPAVELARDAPRTTAAVRRGAARARLASGRSHAAARRAALRLASRGVPRVCLLTAAPPAPPALVFDAGGGVSGVGASLARDVLLSSPGLGHHVRPAAGGAVRLPIEWSTAPAPPRGAPPARVPPPPPPPPPPPGGPGGDPPRAQGRPPAGGGGRAAGRDIASRLGPAVGAGGPPPARPGGRAEAPYGAEWAAWRGLVDSGAIFMCNSTTGAECLDRGVFGGPFGTDLGAVRPSSTAVFLYNFQARELMGVFRCVEKGTGLEPRAFAKGGRGPTPFPQQVRVRQVFRPRGLGGAGTPALGLDDVTGDPRCAGAWDGRRGRVRQVIGEAAARGLLELFEDRFDPGDGGVGEGGGEGGGAGGLARWLSPLLEAWGRGRPGGLRVGVVVEGRGGGPSLGDALARARDGEGRGGAAFDVVAVVGDASAAAAEAACGLLRPGCASRCVWACGPGRDAGLRRRAGGGAGVKPVAPTGREAAALAAAGAPGVVLLQPVVAGGWGFAA